MSRPPRPRSGSQVTPPVPVDVGDLDYLPAEYADLLAVEKARAGTLLGRSSPEAGEGEGTADVTDTFMEMSAVVAHVLAVYQRHLARESFISTARTRGSLLRHARRLAYDPDSGVAASGYVVLYAKPGVSGTVAAGLALGSVPLGESKAQDYETRDDLVVDADLNELVPVDARRPVDITAETTRLHLQGTGHALAPGDRVAVVAEGPDEGAPWFGVARVVEAVVEDDGTGTTAVDLDGGVGDLEVDLAHPPLLLAHPALSLRQFGSDADPAHFPPDEVRDASGVEPASCPKYWYDVTRADQGTAASGYRASDVYLSEQVDVSLADSFLLHRSGTSAQVLRATEQTVAAVALHRVVEVGYTVHTVDLAAKDGGYTSTIKDESKTMPVASHIAGTVTALTVEDSSAATQERSWLPLPSEWLTGWTVQVPLSAEEPNSASLGDSLTLPGILTALTPGRHLVLTDRAGARTQVVSVLRAEADTAAGTTRVEWEEVTPGPDEGWTLDDLVVLGNVARISHGRTVEEVLGGSDGVTAFQEHALRESPVTVLLGVGGGEPELEVRVNDVRWQRVVDFGGSGPEDRHYRVITDEDQVTRVVFGDGRNGAVPPAGRGNLRAVYRVGLGRAGDVEPSRVSRLKRAHPLLDRVTNVTAVSGGAEPADETAVRAQSTRWIRTFDRAVSAADLADLALTIPGVARAASRGDGTGGALVVVATATGDAPPDLAGVRAFLDERRDTAVPMRLTAPDPRSVRITVELEADPAYFVENVKDAVRAALHGEDEGAPGMFTFPARQLGQPAFRSELYAALQSLPGVVGVRVSRFESDDTGPGVAEVVGADVDQWLRLAPNDLLVNESGGVDRR